MVAAVTLIAFPAPLRGEAPCCLRVGAHAGRTGIGEEVPRTIVGAQLTVPVMAVLQAHVSGSHFLLDVGYEWQVETTLRLRHPHGPVYVAGGAHVRRVGIGDVRIFDLGIVGAIGLESRLGRLWPYGEFRIPYAGGVTAQWVLGLSVGFGRS